MRFYLKMAACVAAAAVYGLLLWLRPFCVFTFLLAIPICNWIANVLHELGHLLAYKLLKLQFRRMVISWFVFTPGCKLRIDRQNRLFSASCTCAYSPDIPFWRYRIALLSGAAVTVLCAAASAAAACFTDGRLFAFLLCLAIVCGANALINLLPFSSDRIWLNKIKEERNAA